MAQMRLLLRCITSPVKGFEALLAEPRSLLALGLIVLCAALSHAAVCSRLDFDALTREVASELTAGKGGKSGSVSEAKVNKEALRRLNMTRIVGYARLPIEIPAAAFMGGMLLWLLGLIMRRRVAFRGAFAVAAHVWIPLALRELMSIPVILSHPSLDPSRLHRIFKTDLASLMGFHRPPPGMFLVDPFLIWMAVSFGLACRAAKFRKWQAVIAGAAGWLVLAFASRALF